MTASLLYLLIILSVWKNLECGLIEVAECEPPDYPQWGGYGPRQDFYVAGDVIHYYCDTDTHIGGHFYRRCEDTGSWIGDAPVCDSPAPFSHTNQTSTADPAEENAAALATDANRRTCIKTDGGRDQYWMGVLNTTGMLFRVSVFHPRGNSAYEVMMVKQDGTEFSCGSRVRWIDSLNWEFHNCPEGNNSNVKGIKIKSLSADPLEICEVVAHTITPPSCVDPHFPVENGRLQINRKTATLVCSAGYRRSPDTRLDCIRDGVWTRKTLYCMQRQWEVGNQGPVNRDP